MKYLTNKKFLLVLLALAVLLYGLQSTVSKRSPIAERSSSTDNLAPDEQAWKISLIVPLDEFYQREFEAARFGAQLAVKELNAAGGINKRKLTLVEQRLPSSFAKNEDKNLLLALIAAPEAERENAVRWAETAQVPLFVLNDGRCFTSSTGKPNEVSPYLFNMGLTFQSTLEPLLIHLNEKFSRPDKDFSVYFFGGDTPENRDLIRFAKSHSEALGFKTIATRLDDIRLADYYSVVRNIIIDSPDVLFIANPDLAGQLFLDQAWKLRVDKEMKVASLNSFDVELFPKGTETLTGAYTASKYVQSITSAENTHFVTEMKKPGVPAFALDGNFSVTAYTSVQLAAKGLLKMQKNKSASLSDGLADLEYTAPNGLVRMSAKNHVLEQPLFIVQRTNDSWKILDSLGTAVHPGLEGCAKDDGA